jgi:putative DNA modification/repair radical SAM protein
MMDTIKKLAILGEGASQEQELAANQSMPACFSPQRITDPYQRHRNPVAKGADRFLPGGIHVSPVGGGKSVRLLKVLQTNICEFDCFYCEHRASRDVPRTYVSPEELAQTFMMLHRKKLVDGLFLSSGITKKIDTMQERMVQTAEILRNRHQFKGYIHLKIMPGASHAAVERTIELADRVSLNLEAPTPQHLARLSAKKDFLDGILTRMVWVKRLKETHSNLIRAGQITQFVVGAAGESDFDLMATTDQLYKQIGLRRAYFSAFSPVPDTPLDHLPPAPLLRQHRLYQADWLLRFYDFSLSEMVFDENGLLPLAVDPKMAWAMRHPEFFPIEIQTAPYEMLLRVPGIGPISAKRITELRRSSIITDLKHLTRLGVVTKRAAPFLLLRGRAFPLPVSPRPIQMDLWSFPLTTREEAATIGPTL